MSIFSNIRKGHARAKEHSAKLAEQKKREEESGKKYRHVPTHAAADAFASAPPSWREEDRERIVDMNYRRSAMAHAGQQSFSTPGTPLARVSSGLSYVSYAAPGDDDSVPPMPNTSAYPMARHLSSGRVYSYSGVSPSSSSGALLNSSAPDLSFAHIRPVAVSSTKGSSSKAPVRQSMPPPSSY